MVPKRLVIAAIGSCLVLAACGNELRDEELETQLAGLVAKDLHEFVKADEITVDCPDDIEADVGVEFECELEAQSQTGVVRGVITHEDGGYQYQGAEFSGGGGGKDSGGGGGEAESAPPGDAK